MAGLANVFFRDLFAHMNGGIPPQVLGATTTVSGTIQSLVNSGVIGKWLFRLICTQTASATSAGATSCTVTMKLYTGTASGTMASFAAGVASTALASNSVAMSLVGPFFLELDTRNEYFNNLAAGVSGGDVIYVQPVVIVGATNGIIAALDVLGWEAGCDPAKNYDASSIVAVVETDLY